MGVVKNVGLVKFPKQGSFLGCRTKVVFRYGKDGPEIMGTIVRDDMEDPFKTIIKLDDGRFIEGGECQHSPQAS